MHTAQIVEHAHPVAKGELWIVFWRALQTLPNNQARDRDDLRATRARDRHEELEEQDERTALT